jgi:hypothetical protein
MKRTIFFAILIFSFLTAIVSAQTNEQEILVQGNPPLKEETIDKSADFFQWALGGNFTAQELDEYRQQLIRIWKENDSGAIKVTGEIVAMRDKLVNAPPEKLKTLISDLQNGLLKELRAQPNDGLSIVLLKMYNRSHKLDVKQGGNLPKPQIPNNDISAFIGEWEESHVGNTNLPTGTGSSYQSSDHGKNIIRFFPDGSYRSAYVTQSKGFGCTFYSYQGGHGAFKFDSGTLYLNEQTRRAIKENSCAALDNYDKEVKAGNYAYPFQIGQDEKGLKIVLMVNGKPHAFYKVQGKGFLGDN